jgi:hypothetical protein
MYEAKIEKPPGWVKGLLWTALVLLIIIGFPIAGYLDLESQWSKPITLGCATGQNIEPPINLRLKGMTVIVPPGNCWSDWLITPRPAQQQYGYLGENVGIFIEAAPPNLSVYWHYSDGGDYEQIGNDSNAPMYREVAGAKFKNSGNEPIAIPIRFR